MSRLDHTFIDLEIHVAGVVREVSARVEYIHSRAYGPIVERGSGIPISPPEPEMAEIQRVIIYNAESNHDQRDIIMLLTDEQIDAISNEILGG